jgi:predicted AlkP superfamily pyrophosphatase or phosphodiesterase
MFVRLFRAVSIALVSALVLSNNFFPARAAAPKTPDTDNIVVMISIDGLGGYYLDDSKAEMPTLRKLAAEGARASSMKPSTPTVTWPNHTTLVTGVTPAKHGVLGNNYLDRKTRKKVQLISDPVFDKDEIVKVPTIYDLAKQAAMKTAAIRWPATRNAKALDWTLPDVLTAEVLRRYTTPSLVTECEKAGIDLFAPGSSPPPTDENATRAFNLILKENRPRLALLHVIDVDHTEHFHGPKSPEAYAAVKTADDQVRQVWDELQRDYPGKATLFVVSDHGFSAIEHSILANVILRNAGLVNVSGSKAAGGAVQLVVQGGSAFVYVMDKPHRAEVMQRVKKAFANVDGMLKVVGSDEFKKYGVPNPKDDPRAPDMILFSKEGWNFGDTAAGQLSFVDKPERKGSHGHDADIPDLHATFVAWGAGIKPGVRLGEISNLDVAPTIAKLLGLRIPNADGKALNAALAN